MRWKSSYVFAAGILAVIVLYFVVRGIFGAGDREAHANDTKNAAAVKQADPLVQAVLTAEQVKPYAVVMRGRTEAARAVVARAETAGVVASTPARDSAPGRYGRVVALANGQARAIAQ